jgi:hypothetical protein
VKALLIALSLMAGTAVAQENQMYNSLGTAYRIDPANANVTAYTSASTAVTVSSTGLFVYRLVCTTDCNVSVGTSPTATASSTLLPAYIPEYFVVERSNNLAVRGASSGNIYTSRMKR